MRFEVANACDGPPEEVRLLRAIIEAGEACLDWVKDVGDCHLCNYDKLRGHDDGCPLHGTETLP